MTQTTDIWATIESYLDAERLELDDLELIGQGRGRVLRVVVDGEDVNLDRLAELSRGLSRLLDDEPGLQDRYQLEVTSPGLERALRRPSHYLKSIGRVVKVKFNSGGKNKTVRGELSSAGDDRFVIATENGDEEIEYDDVVSAKTVFEWERAPKPGH